MTDRDARPHCVWDYAPAPESPTTSGCASRYDLFIGGEFRRPRRRRAASRRSTRRPRSRSPRSRSPAEADVRARGRGRARGAAGQWAALPALERGKYLFRIARLIQERARELAVVESLDGGKPIRESRDVDIPLAAAHFFSLRGLGRQAALRARRPRAASRCGVVGQIVPWNFPLLMAAWKLAPALACGNTAVLKPAETTPLTALLLAEICQEAELPAGVVNILTGDGTPAPRWCARTSTRSPSPARPPSARTSSARWPARDIGPDARARRQVGQHRLRGRRARPGGRGHRRGHLLQPGPRLLRGLAAAAAGERRRRGRAQAVGADGAPARRRPARQEHRRRRDQLAPRSSRASRRSSTAGEQEGATRRSIACALPERGYWFPPTLFTDVAPAHRIAVEEIFGPVVSVTTFRTPGRGDRAREQLRLRPGRRRLDRQRLQGVRGRERAARRRRVAEHLQPLRPDGRVRRLQGERLRPRGRPGRAAAVREV